MGIKVLPPDVNESDADFTPRGTDIRFGLSAVRNVGGNVVDGLIEARASQGPVRRLRPTSSTRSTIVVVQQARRRVADQGRRLRLASGRAARACSSCTRRGSTPVLDIKRNEAIGQVRPLRRVRRRRRRRRCGAVRTAADPDRGVGQGDPARLRAGDARALRLRPPAQRRRARPRRGDRRPDLGAARPTTSRDGRTIVVGGLVTSVQRKVTKQGNVWAIATLEDLEASIEVMFFPPTYQLVGPHVVADAVLARQGPPRQARGGGAASSSRWRSASPTCPPASRARSSSPCPRRRCIPPVVDRLKEMLAATPGSPRSGSRCSQRPAHHRRPARRPAPRHALPGALRRPQGAARPVLPCSNDRPCCLKPQAFPGCLGLPARDAGLAAARAHESCGRAE